MKAEEAITQYEIKSIDDLCKFASQQADRQISEEEIFILLKVAIYIKDCQRYLWKHCKMLEEIGLGI